MQLSSNLTPHRCLAADSTGWGEGQLGPGGRPGCHCTSPVPRSTVALPGLGFWRRPSLNCLHVTRGRGPPHTLQGDGRHCHPGEAKAGAASSAAAASPEDMPGKAQAHPRTHSSDNRLGPQRTGLRERKASTRKASPLPRRHPPRRIPLHSLLLLGCGKLEGAWVQALTTSLSSIPRIHLGVGGAPAQAPSKG